MEDFDEAKSKLTKLATDFDEDIQLEISRATAMRSSQLVAIRVDICLVFALSTQ